MKKNNLIIIDYYQGAYGPTIRIETHSESQLMQIRNVVTGLKDGTFEEFQVTNLTNIKITSLQDILMKREIIRKGYYNSIKIIENTNMGPLFLWLQTEDGWWHTQGLIDGLLEGLNAPEGYQYISSEFDKTIIELCRV